MWRLSGPPERGHIILLLLVFLLTFYWFSACFFFFPLFTFMSAMQEAAASIKPGAR